MKSAQPSSLSFTHVDVDVDDDGNRLEPGADHGEQASGYLVLDKPWSARFCMKDEQRVSMNESTNAPTGCTTSVTPHHRQARAAIVDAAFRLFDERGYDETSVDDIADTWAPYLTMSEALRICAGLFRSDMPTSCCA